MSQTLVGVFDRRDDAKAVAQELIGTGIPQTHIRLSDDTAAPAAPPAPARAMRRAFGRASRTCSRPTMMMTIATACARPRAAGARS